MALRPGHRGVALVVVLWTLLLLSLIAAGFIAVTRTEVRLARNALDNARAEALADAGVYRGVQELLRLPNDRQWRADGTVYRFEDEGGVVRISIQDEGGKIDLNQGRDAHLKALFLLAGIDEPSADALVDAIADFRDEDDLRRLNGAEDPDYPADGLAHGAKDRPFEAVDELRQVKGMTHALFEQVAPYLTVYSERQQIDLMTAPRQVLLAVPGIGPGEVEELLTVRARTVGPIPREPLPLPVVERKTFAMSENPPYTIRAEAKTGNGAAFVREAVVHPTRGAVPAFRFLAWRQGNRAFLEDDDLAPE